MKLDTAEKIQNAFGCPANIANIMANNPTPLLEQIMKLGPDKIQWMGQPSVNGMGQDLSLTCWGKGDNHFNVTDIMHGRV